MHEMMIIGGGPAGMTAALYAARKALDIVLITEEFGGQAMWTRDVENYMGYQFITGPELMAKFEEQVKQFPIKTVYDRAVLLEVRPDGSFALQTEAGEEYLGKTAIIATGKSPRRLEVPGEKEFTGRGVSYCATCDGPLFRDKTVAVIGSGNSAVQAAIELDLIADKVYLVARDEYVADPVVLEKMRQAKKVEEIFGYGAQKITGGDVVEKFILQKVDDKTTKELSVQGVFVEVGLIPNSGLAPAVIDKNKAGEIIVDCQTRTDIPGLCAAGDVTNGPDKQIVIAAGEGSKAALTLHDYLITGQWRER